MERYGLNWPEPEAGVDPSAAIELAMAFNERFGVAPGFLGRYQHFRNATDLIWNEPRRRYAAERGLKYDRRRDDAFIWNDWSELMSETFCEWHETTSVWGPNACVAGHTRLGDRTIRDLCESGVAPVVQTLYGAEQADVPFVKGEDDLYEVTLSDGSRFTATLEHRVLTVSGYVRVGSLASGSRLFGYEPILPGSNLDGDLSAHVLDARGSPRRVEDSMADCRRAFRFYGDKPPLINAVVSIKWTSRATFYDLTVPRAAHYFAEGAIHHNSWKTTNAAIYGLAAWYSSPADTIVVVTSTTLPGLRKRIWKEITKYHRVNPGLGFVNNTDIAIRYLKGSDEAGIFGIPTGQEQGDVEKAFNKIIGFHAPNVIAILDEGQATNEAIVKAAVSLRAGARRFQLIIVGNPESELDTLGQISEPVGGYNTITPEMDRWETRNGVCIHLDGLESPRVKEGDEYYPGLLRQADIDSTIREYGEDSPEFWRGRRGFVAPQGVQKTVLSSAMIAKFRAREKAIWKTTYTEGAGLDPAFEGGDRCILRIGRIGENDEGKMIVDTGESITIKVSVSSLDPIHYQIVRQVRDICQLRGIPPRLFALDSTGEGGGLASIFIREWSPEILQVEFGGAASERPISETNPRPANKEYLYRVTELWYAFRTLVQNGQVRGLDQATAIEFCQRLYEMRGNLQMVESKKQMKTRTKRSPDLADSAVVLIELFRQRANLLAGHSVVGSVEQPNDQWAQLARKYDVRSDYSIA